MIRRALRAPDHCGSWQRRNFAQRDKPGPKFYLRDLFFHDSVDRDRDVAHSLVPFEVPKRIRDLTHREVPGHDPRLTHSLAVRVERLEALTFPMRATFIQESERPTVGDEPVRGKEHLNSAR